MQNILIACSQIGRDAVTELPFLLTRAGFSVTLLCGRKTRQSMSSHYDKWIKASEEAPVLLQQLVEFVEQNPAAYDWIMVGDDDLLRALADSSLDPALKARLGPVQKPEYFSLLGSKVEVARFCRDLDILMPPSAGAGSVAEAIEAAEKIGFPVLIKIDRSGGGDGVFKCENASDIQARAARLDHQRLLVEKFIAGDLISVDALFMNSRLVAYAHSRVLLADGFGVSARRLYVPHPTLSAPLESLAENFGLHGLFNLSYIREKETGRYFLIELDLRPNAWSAAVRFAGLDFGQALKNHLREGAPPVEVIREIEVALPHREVRHFILHKRPLALLDVIFNPARWKFFPFYDPPFIFFQFVRLWDYMAPRQWEKLRAFLRRVSPGSSSLQFHTAKQGFGRIFR